MSVSTTATAAGSGPTPTATTSYLAAGLLIFGFCIGAALSPSQSRAFPPHTTTTNNNNNTIQRASFDIHSVTMNDLRDLGDCLCPSGSSDWRVLDANG
jgi:hypothetical protein